MSELLKHVTSQPNYLDSRAYCMSELLKHATSHAKINIAKFSQGEL